MFLANLIILFFTFIFLCLTLKFLSKTSLIYSFKKRLRSLEEKCYVYQFYKVPKFNENMQENHLYHKVYTYLNSLPTVEDSDFVNLFSGSKSSKINLVIDENQSVFDKFLGAKLQWKIENYENQGVIVKTLVLKIRKHDRRRILGPYLQHIHQIFEDMEMKKKDVRLFINMDTDVLKNGRWRSVRFTHPATMETMVMDADLKNRIKSDLESFLKSKQYYHRLGRVWKRSYLLYGSAGTGKSTFIAAMAKFLGYDVYEINLNKVASDTDLQYLLLQTTNKSLIVVEDLDRYVQEKSRGVSLSGIRNFMDGIFSCCGEERVMVFTVNSKENIGASFLRPGRIDVHINFPLCDFTAFKSLASSHLGIKDHKLFPQVEEIFQTGVSLSPAEICELMISNRSSPSRAVKTVITALQGNLVGRIGRRSSWSGSGKVADDSSESGLGLKEQSGIHPIKEIKNLYGFLRAKSSRKISIDFDVNEKEHSDSNHGNSVV